MARSKTHRKPRWSDWYREFMELAQQNGIPPEAYEGLLRQGDEYIHTIFRDGNTPQEAIEWIRDRHERRQRSGEARETQARARTHNEVDFAVDDTQSREHIFKTFDEAAGFALGVGASHGQPVNLDVLVWSEEGAEWYGGSDAVDAYNEDPEASVFERYEITVNAVGMVP